eukprot:5115887-Pyramimonas_sp.AAC.1
MAAISSWACPASSMMSMATSAAFLRASADSCVAMIVLATECGEFLGGSAFVRGSIACFEEVPPRGERGKSPRHPEFFGQTDTSVGEACPMS